MDVVNHEAFRRCGIYHSVAVCSPQSQSNLAQEVMCYHLVPSGCHVSSPVILTTECLPSGILTPEIIVISILNFPRCQCLHTNVPEGSGILADLRLIPLNMEEQALASLGRRSPISVILSGQLHDDDSWEGNTQMSPVPVSLHLLAFQLKPSLPGLRAPERPLFKPSRRCNLGVRTCPCNRMQ